MNIHAYFLYLANMLQEFLTYLEAEKRYSSNTVRAYADDIRQFYAHVGLTNDETTAEGTAAYFTFQLVRGWLVELIRQGVSPRSVNRKKSSLASFFKFLLRKRFISSNPMQKVVTLKQAKRLPTFLDETKLNGYLDVSAEGSTYEHVRDHTIVELFYATGIRLSELVSLTYLSVDLSSSLLKVKGKGAKERFVPLTSAACEYIGKYMKNRDLKFGDSYLESSLFLTSKGKPIYHRLVYSIVKRQLSSGGFTGKRSPHVLRHTFATHMLNHGADLNSIKDILGHSSLGATQVYAHTTFEKLKQVHKRAHPHS